MIYLETSENDSKRGLHIVVINPYSGTVESACIFDTYISGEKLDDFIY